MNNSKTMRDSLLEQLLPQMQEDPSLFILSADMGAPALDHIRHSFPSRFINVGIAEQNLIAVASGLAMEGCTVYTLAIAAFYLRAFEQIRNNLSIAGTFVDLNVHMLAVGGGVSYDMSGPSHHALEDLAVLRTLPHISLFSLSDWQMAAAWPAYARQQSGAKYVRLDSKAHLPLSRPAPPDWSLGFQLLRPGRHIALISTGFMSQKAATLLQETAFQDVALLDLFQLSTPLQEEALAATLAPYSQWITLQEGYLERGGLDTLLEGIRNRYGHNGSCRHLGFALQHQFTSAPREQLHAAQGMGMNDLRQLLTSLSHRFCEGVA
ncbi:transketolase family protein [Candidatus Magnetaquicoccus inordinatus]|uniref:transketolase family protein n=1 Tax=Candidatus Magnetaquicoccus inordinatus TaxID=2496818 RepID=UPI00102C9520|nr:transketolase [Candidatus Magnetaquicoccus inordinatus]